MMTATRGNFARALMASCGFFATWLLLSGFDDLVGRLRTGGSIIFQPMSRMAM